MESLGCMSLICPILEYGTSCWGPYREGQINALGRVQKKAAKFANHTNHPFWGTLAQLKNIARICALFKAYIGELAWKFIWDRFKGPFCLNRDNHDRKFRARKQRTDTGKYIFVILTFRGPCIVLYSYNKSQQDALFLTFIW